MPSSEMELLSPASSRAKHSSANGALVSIQVNINTPTYVSRHSRTQTHSQEWSCVRVSVPIVRNISFGHVITRSLLVHERACVSTCVRACVRERDAGRREVVAPVNDAMCVFDFGGVLSLVDSEISRS